MTQTVLLPASPLTPAAHLRVDGVSRSFPDRRVLTDVSFVVAAGEVACLVGENGSGKSTLLRIAAGYDVPDAGSVSAPGTVGLFHQEPPFPLSRTVGQVLDDATAPLQDLTARVEHEGRALAAGDPGAAVRLQEAIEAADHREAWDLDHRVDRVVDGLGLTSVPRDRRARDLSGGQLSRLCLAFVLLRSPDTLLLDEPTNHLDDHGTALLVDLLGAWAGPVLVASHDRAFLDEVATTLLDLDPAPAPHAVVRHDPDSPGSGFGVRRFTGTWTAYLGQRREERARWVRRFRDEQAELGRLRARLRDDHTVGHADRPPPSEVRSSRKFYADRNAKVVSRRVDDARAALARLEDDQVRRPPSRLRFRGLGRPGGDPDPGSWSGTPDAPVLTATAVRVDGRLAPTGLAVGARGRLLVTGANGSGKSTLLEILAGRLAPGAGRVGLAPGLRTALLAQEPARRDPAVTVRESYAAAVGPELAGRTPLSTFGLVARRDEQREVGALSVGQRRRLDLAVLLADPPDVLLLDEPTNHLSLLLVSELELSLPDFPGAVVVATHDRWLREDWAGDRLHLAGPTG
jgi:macrolide transport system ATP-binding/permease protein